MEWLQQKNEENEFQESLTQLKLYFLNLPVTKVIKMPRKQSAKVGLPIFM
jgi:hypothetical protein